MTAPNHPARRGGPNHADDLRGRADAPRRLAAALADPTGSADLLADVLNDRGTRDALLVTAFKSDRWDDLADAARAGGAAALASGRSVYGPLTVLGVAHWLLGQERDAAQMLSAVPPADPAHRLADLARQLIARGTPAAEWVQRMRSLTVDDCLDYRPPHPAAVWPPPAGAERWFQPLPPPDRRADIWALLGVGYSGGGPARAAAGGFPLPDGPASLVQTLARTGETAAGPCLIVASVDDGGRLQHIHRIATDLAAPAPPGVVARPAGYAVVACGGAPDHLAAALADRLGNAWAPVALLDVLQVQPDGRWTSLACPDPACCPPDGRPAPDDPLLGWQLDDALTGAADPGPGDPLAGDPLAGGPTQQDGPVR